MNLFNKSKWNLRSGNITEQILTANTDLQKKWITVSLHIRNLNNKYVINWSNVAGWHWHFQQEQRNQQTRTRFLDGV